MVLRSLRLVQIHLTSGVMRQLTRLRLVSSLLGLVRRWPIVKQGIHLAAGYNRVFPDMADARRCVRWYARLDHDSAENTRSLVRLMTTTRPSDYPMLFHLGRLPLDGLRVFDLGGATGELFHLYDHYLRFPGSVRWIVHDLPLVMERGREIARQRGESRLSFTPDVHAASGCDVLVISGSLHYFDMPLADFLTSLPVRPRHVLINRTPLVEPPTAATVQYVNGVMVACHLFNLAELIASMEKAGYEAIDSWSVPELSIKLPYDPAYRDLEYRGLYFRERADRQAVPDDGAETLSLRRIQQGERGIPSLAP